MAELRYNPFKRDWIMIASHRQNRPQMPKDWCPFCPGSGKVPDRFDVHKYDNDFPALSEDPPQPDDVGNDFFRVRPAYGKCEVILYSSEHFITLPQLSEAHVKKLVDLWCERMEALSADDSIDYVFIFENRGAAVGVTMPHPHGQIYGYPYIPKKLVDEIAAAQDYKKANGSCLFCDWLSEERSDGRRIIFENDHFVVVLPFFSELAYGVQIVSKEHVQYITDLSDSARISLAKAVRETVGMLDSLFAMEFPYMMCMHQAPSDGRDYSEFYHFHIEFFPPMRSADKIQYNASSETGAWAHCNPTAPEEKAVELRAAHEKYLNSF